MSNLVEVKIPDIGDFKEVAVIDVLVKPGDRLKAEDSLVTLESDKATMDVPSPSAGTVRDVKVKVGDMVSEGTVVLLLDTVDVASAPDNLMSGRAGETADRTSMSRGPRLDPSGEASRASVSAVRAAPATPAVMAAPEPAIRAPGGSLSGPPPKPGQGEEVNAPPPVVLMPGPAEIG